MRIFASDKVSAFMKKMGMDEGESIEHAWVTKAIENAQKKVEGHNFDIRKHLLDYDDVANEQRKFIYSQRDDFLNEDKRLDIVNYIIDDVFTKLINSYISEEENDIEEFNEILKRDFNIEIDISSIIRNSDKEDAIEKFIKEIHGQFESVISNVPDEIYIQIIKDIYINIADKNWIEHIQSMEFLRQGIGLRSYAQKIQSRNIKEKHLICFR